MASIAILITAPPYDSGASHRALCFARACVAAGHSIAGVFFYQAGVQHGNALITHFSDEPNIARDWQAFGKDHKVPLLLCISAANRRGILGDIDAKEWGLAISNLRKGYQAIGLGEFVSLSETADRTVQFN